MNSDQIQSKIDANLDELSLIMSMPESEACRVYNVDFKQEIIDLINEDTKILNDDLYEAIQYEEEHELEWLREEEDERRYRMKREHEHINN